MDEVENVIFVSLTNKTNNLPKNVISFGININSQLKAIKEYLNKNNFVKTILLVPESQFADEIEQIIKKKKFNFYKIYKYETNPKKITAEIEKISLYKERKWNLKSRVKQLENSEEFKDQQELKKLKERYTLGKVDFDSVIVADFGERLKTVLSSFIFSDVTSAEVKFLTLNQWFDEGLFEESSMENLLFPSINLKNFNSFNKKYFETFNKITSEISILAYDAIGLIYYTWMKTYPEIKFEKIYRNVELKGLQGDFFIDKNASFQKLQIYEISEKKFIKIN